MRTLRERLATLDWRTDDCAAQFAKIWDDHVITTRGADEALLHIDLNLLHEGSFHSLQNGMLPVILPGDACRRLCEALTAQPGAALTIDLASQTVIAPNGERHAFQIDGAYKERLLSGVDDIGLGLQHVPAIEAYETRRRAEKPWLPRKA